MMTSFISLLTVAFIALKLTDHIDWDWWLVLSPMIGYAVYMVTAIVGVLAYGIYKGNHLKDR